MKNVLKKNQIMITALAIMIAVAGYLNFAGSKLEQEELLTANSDAVEGEAYVADAGDSDTLAQIDQNYNLSGVLDISDEDIEQANLTDIESLDTDMDVASADYLDEGMAEAVENEAELPMDQAVSSDSAQAKGASGGASQTGAEVSDGEVPGEAVFTQAAGVSTLSGAKLLKEQTRAKNKETLLEIINNAALSESQKQEAVDNMIALTDVAEKETSAEILLEAKGFSDVVVSISNDMADVVVGASELSDAQRAQIEDVIKRKTGIAAENIVISPVIAN